jgi:hypothetical protein
VEDQEDVDCDVFRSLRRRDFLVGAFAIKGEQRRTLFEEDHSFAGDLVSRHSVISTVS